MDKQELSADGALDLRLDCIKALVNNSHSMDRIHFIIWIFLFGLMPDVAAQTVKTSLERESEIHAMKVKELDAKLVEAFDKEVGVVRLQSGINPQKRQEIMDGLEQEKGLFLRHGSLPFSPRMRASTQSYLRQYQAVTARLEKEFDGLIVGAMRRRDDALASQLASQKKEASRKSVGAWECKGTNFRHAWSWILYSDGTTNSATATWEMKSKEVVVNNKCAGAPPSGWFDRWELADDGLSFKAKNQKGAAHIGHRTE